MARKIKIHKVLNINEARLKYRHGWEINPKTRVVQSKKLYKRSRAKQKFYKDLQDET